MKKRRLKRGDKVEIFSAQKDRYLGEGVFDKYVIAKFEGLRVRIPRFRLGRRIIHGYECWWIPAVPFRAQAYAALRKLQQVQTDPLSFLKNTSSVKDFQIGDWMKPTSSTETSQ